MADLLVFGWCHGCFSVPTGAHASNKHVCESYGSKNNSVYPFEASLAPGCHPGFSYAWARRRMHARATRTAHGRALGGTASRALEHQLSPRSSARCPIPMGPPKIADGLSEKRWPRAQAFLGRFSSRASAVLEPFLGTRVPNFSFQAIIFLKLYERGR